MDRDARNWHARVARMRVPLGGSTMSLQRERTLILTVLLILTAGSWALLIWQSTTAKTMGMGLTMGMGAALSLSIWVVMMMAMMFPAAAPMILALWFPWCFSHGPGARSLLPGVLLAALRAALPSGHDEYCGPGAAHGPDLRRKSRPAWGTHRPVRSPGPDPLRSACDCRARCAPTRWRRHVTGRHADNWGSGTSQVTSRCVLDRSRPETSFSTGF